MTELSISADTNEIILIQNDLFVIFYLALKYSLSMNYIQKFHFNIKNRKFRK